MNGQRKLSATANREDICRVEPVLLFDGVCNLCNAAVQFVVERDSAGRVCFASLQSETAKKLLQAHGLSTKRFESVVLLDNGQVYTKSTAILRLTRKLDGPWPLTFGLILVPRFLRDKVYDFVANRRYRWFGKRESCMILSPNLKERVLHD